MVAAAMLKGAKGGVTCCFPECVDDGREQDSEVSALKNESFSPPLFLKRFTDVPNVPALLRDLHDTESARWRRAWFNYQILTGGKDLMVSVPRAE